MRPFIFGLRLHLYRNLASDPVRALVGFDWFPRNLWVAAPAADATAWQRWRRRRRRSDRRVAFARFVAASKLARGSRATRNGQHGWCVAFCLSLSFTPQVPCFICCACFSFGQWLQLLFKLNCAPMLNGHTSVSVSLTHNHKYIFISLFISLPLSLSLSFSLQSPPCVAAAPACFRFRPVRPPLSTCSSTCAPH